MPKVWQKYIKSGSLSGLWKISESKEELESLLSICKPEDISHEGRALQWLASRVLLQDLLIETGQTGPFELTKLPNGKPVCSVPGLHISISHAGDYAAVVLSDHPIGIDIEKLGQRIQRIHRKFMNQEDLDLLHDDQDIIWMHTVWSAKEALFKFHPDGNIDFKEHLHLKKVREGLLAAQIRKGRVRTDLQVPYEHFGSYIIAWAFE